MFKFVSKVSRFDMKEVLKFVVQVADNSVGLGEVENVSLENEELWMMMMMKSHHQLRIFVRSVILGGLLTALVSEGLTAIEFWRAIKSCDLDATATTVSNRAELNNEYRQSSPPAMLMLR